MVINKREKKDLKQTGEEYRKSLEDTFLNYASEQGQRRLDKIGFIQLLLHSDHILRVFFFVFLKICCGGKQHNDKHRQYSYTQWQVPLGKLPPPGQVIG